jgi:5'-nucleotidase
MIRNLIILLVLGAGLWACSDVYTISVSSDPVEINNTIPANAEVEAFISPYREELSASMDVEIAYAKNDFVKGRPNAALNNWAADAIRDYELSAPSEIRQLPVMCLLNVGGLRNPISEGTVSLGDIYKLMPFDNEIVWVEMPWESLADIAIYLNASGGEPISGATLVDDSLMLDGVSEPTTSFWVVTSDYLMNGGDRMNFFENKIGYHYGDGLMRDAMIFVAKMQDTLHFDTTERIQL